MRELFKDLDNRIRLGKAREVVHRLHKVNTAKIPRELLVEAANIARRAGIPIFAVRLLNPIVRNQEDLIHPATPREQAEYAVALTRIGVVTEAKKILDTLDASSDPMVFLYRAYAAFAEWDSAAAIGHLQEFVVAPGVDDYMRLVGQVNLASGLIGASRYREADQLLVELREHTLTGGHDLLYGNCLELSSQSAMFQRDFSRAAEFLEKGLCVFGEKKNIYEFFVRKDQAFLRLLNEGPNAAALDELAGIRREAETLGHWESIRDCDFYRAVAEQDDRLLNHVWYGTPFASYREKMVEMYGSPVQISRSHVWRSDEQEERPNRVFDMRLAKEGNVAELKPGQLVHRLFAILNSDYYRPFRMGEIYSKLFPNDYFCPFSSPDRIYQLVKRLRQWLAKSGIPIQVVEKDGDYALASEEPYGIKVYKEKVGKPSQLVVFLRLKQEWGERLFSARELSEFAEFSHSKANTLIAWAVDHGFLEKVGSGPRIKYRLCAADESPLAA